MDPDSELDFDFSPFLHLYKSGRVVRLMGTHVVPAGVDPATGVASKDVIIDSGTGLAARLYLPEPSSCPADRLPILLYFHGGVFVIESAFSPVYHNFLNKLVARAGAVMVVSVEYRRAPEHRLPVAYEDALAALNWVASHAGCGGGQEAWLAERGDLGRVFVAGDSAGGNIAHNAVMSTRAEPLQNGVKVKGVALLDAYWWGKEPVGSEPTDVKFRRRMESGWEFVCGYSSGVEDPQVDPLRAELKVLPCRRALISVAGKDLFRDRGRAYYEKLKATGWEGEAELFEAEDEEHVYFLGKLDSVKTLKEMDNLIHFISRN